MQGLIGTQTTSFKGKDESQAILRVIIQDYKIQTISLLHVKYEDILLIRRPCRDPVLQATVIYGPSAKSNLLTPVQTTHPSLGNARAFSTVYCSSSGERITRTWNMDNFMKSFDLLSVV